MIKYYQRTLRQRQLQILDTFKVGSWIDVTAPTPEEIAFLAQSYDLDAGHLQDALDIHEVPRVEKEGQILYLFFRLPVAAGSETVTQPCLFILAPTFFATVTSANYPQLQRFTEHPELFTSQKSKALVILMMLVLSTYHQTLNSISKQVNASLAKLEYISNRDIITLIKHERSVNEMLSSVIPLHEALHTVLTGKLRTFFTQDQELVEDLYLGLGQFITVCKNQMLFIRNTRDAYSTVMTNTLNRVIKLFTSLTVILTVPTIVASFYGMNVRLPGSNHDLAFGAIVGVTLICIISLVWFFNRRDWL